MNFRDYLKLDELFDIASMDTSDIELDRITGGYRYEFEYEGEQFKVDMRRTDANFDIGWSTAYDISLTGPYDYSLTGEAGMSANIIYRNMLLAVKKLFEKEDVEALKFLAYEPRMVPMYRLFYKKYLRPNPPRGVGFIMVKDDLYVRKDIVRDKMKKIGQIERDRGEKNSTFIKSFLGNVVQTNREGVKEAEEVNRIKRTEKQIALIFKKNKSFVYVIKVRKNPDEILMVSKKFEKSEYGGMNLKKNYVFKKRMGLSVGSWQFNSYQDSLHASFVELVRPATSEEIEEIKTNYPEAFS
jgi:hypothetical protein